MKVKNKVSLSLALLLAINFLPAFAKADEAKNDEPSQEVLSPSKDEQTEKNSKQDLLSDKEAKDQAEKTDDFAKKVAAAKDELKKYLDSMDEESVDNPSIIYEGQTKEEIKKSIARAKELLADEDIDQAELEEMEKIPFKKIDGKKQGLFRGYTHKALVDFEVQGERNNLNPHNNKKYVGLVNNKFTIKSTVKGLKKVGEDDKQFIKLNYVTEDDYKAIKVDGVSSSTPKYKKAELDRDSYIIREIENGYEVEITKLPAGTKFIKPIVLVKLADETYFENGDLVYAKNEADTNKEASKADDKAKDSKKADTKKEVKVEKKGQEKAQKEVKEHKEEKAKASEKAPAKNVKTGVDSSLITMAILGFSSTALFVSKKRNK